MAYIRLWSIFAAELQCKYNIKRKTSMMEPGIIRKTVVSIPDTLRGMPVGKKILFDASETVAYNTAYFAVRRINEGGKHGRFRIEKLDNGCSYTIERVA